MPAPAHAAHPPRAGARSGLPPSAVVGASFAVDARYGRSAGPYRWALLSAVIAMIVVTTTLTFGASLHTLVSQPALYGWNWDYAVQSSDGYGPVPNQAVATLRHDPAVTSFSGVSFVTMQLDGVEVPTLLSRPGAPVGPPILSGHALSSSHQIVLGAATLAQLHKRIGDTVDLQYVPGYPRRPIPLRIVGVATMPAIGIAEGLHTSMGIGAAVPADAGPVTESLGPQGYAPSCNGPNMVFLRVRGGQGAPQGLAAAQRLSDAANQVLGRQAPDSVCGGTWPASSPCSTRPRSRITGPWARPRCCSRPPWPWLPWWPSDRRWRHRCGAAAEIWPSSESSVSSSGSWPQRWPGTCPWRRRSVS